MSDGLPRDTGPGNAGPGGSPLRMAALSLLLHQVMKRSHRLGEAAAARDRVGHDFGSLLDSLFGTAKKDRERAGVGSGLGGLINGMEGFLHELREHGLRRQVDSWVSNASNAPVAPGEIAPAFDGDELDAMAQRAGSDRESLLREISVLLPDFIHRMTPHGAVPQKETEIPGGLSALLQRLLHADRASGPPRS